MHGNSLKLIVKYKINVHATIIQKYNVFITILDYKLLFSRIEFQLIKIFVQGLNLWNGFY